MNYVLKNLQGFAKNHTGLFCLVVGCQIVCILLTFASFGIYQSFRAESQISDADQYMSGEKEYDANFAVNTHSVPENMNFKISNLESFFLDAAMIVGKKSNAMGVACINDIYFSLTYEKNELLYYQQLEGNIKANPVLMGFQNWFTKEELAKLTGNPKWIDGDRFITNEEWLRGDKVCVIPIECVKNIGEPYVGPMTDKEGNALFHADGTPIMSNENKPYLAYYQDGQYFCEIEGVIYKVVGITGMPYIYLPFQGIPDTIYIEEYPSISLTKPLTYNEYNALVDLYYKTFLGLDAPFAKLVLYDPEKINYYNTNMAISALIAVVSALNLVLIMRYILMKRRKALAIFRITGCSFHTARRIYAAEILLMLTVLFLACWVFFDKFLVHQLAYFFKEIEGAYSIKTYGLFFIVYIGISYLFLNTMIVSLLRKTPVTLLKKNG